MTRKTVSELLAEVDASFPDNNTGQITPALLRTMFKDFLDSVRPTTVSFYRQTPISPSTPSPITLGWEFLAGVPSPDFTASAPNLGRFARLGNNTQTNFVVDLTVKVPTGAKLTVGLYKNGVDTGYSEPYTSVDGNTERNITIVGTTQDAAEPASYDIRVTNTAANFTFVRGHFLMIASARSEPA